MNTDSKIDAAFDAFEQSFNTHCDSLEKLIASAKVQLAWFYVCLAIILHCALALDRHWVASRQAQVIARSDQRFKAMLERLDQRLQQAGSRSY